MMIIYIGEVQPSLMPYSINFLFYSDLLLFCAGSIGLFSAQKMEQA